MFGSTCLGAKSENTLISLSHLCRIHTIDTCLFRPLRDKYALFRCLIIYLSPVNGFIIVFILHTRPGAFLIWYTLLFPHMAPALYATVRTRSASTSNLFQVEKLCQACSAFQCKHAVVYSPDTDTYHIGLPLVSREVYVRVDMPGSQERKYINIPKLSTAICNDPDLQQLSQPEKVKVMQVLFIATGCDFTLFFRSLGKSSIDRTFCQHAEFISSGEAVPGLLSEV